MNVWKSGYTDSLTMDYEGNIKITTMWSNPIRSIKCLSEYDPIQSNLNSKQPNPWMNPIHV